MYGVNAAIILQNIYFWVLKNKANKKHFYDGKYWTYNSRSAFNELFPYLSERQIKTAIDKLVKDGVVEIGCYNKDARDRTMWYTVTKKGACILQKCDLQTTEMSDANDGIVRPLPDINTDINTDINVTKNTSYSCSEPEKSVSKRTKKSTTTKRFIPPTVEEVAEYVNEKGYKVNPQRFVDHYAARGWKYGQGKPMVDWKAAVRTWVSNEYNDNNYQQPSQPKGRFDRSPGAEIHPWGPEEIYI